MGVIINVFMHKDIKNKVIVILGPTSSGKSDVAIRLAKKFDGEIISADSRQIYRKLNLGTGKIHGKWGMKHRAFISEKISHYFIDIVNPTASYNVANFKKNANKIIKDILSRGKIPIICGGTGFWIKAVVDNVNFPEVKPNWKLRNKLSNRSPVELFMTLKKMDPERAKSIDRFNKIRLIRAIEICKTLKKVPTPSFTPSPYQGEGWGEVNFLQIGISLTKEKLYSNIKKRLKKRFKQGMIKEVEKLHSKEKLSWKKIQSFGLAYYWIPLYLKDKISKDELFEKVYSAEKDYAKRQITWFRKDKRIKWIKNHKEIEKETKKFIK